MNKKMMGLILCFAFLLLTSAWSQQVKTKPSDHILAVPQAGNVAALLPHIDSVTVHCDGGPCAEYDLVGKNFGANQGARRVRINGGVATGYPHWSANSITVTGPALFWDMAFVFVIDNGTTPISNTVTSYFQSRWDGAVPSQAHAGDTITIHALGAGATQMGHILKMGTAAMVVTSWSGTNYAETIVAKVPALAPGNYEIVLFNGVNKISTPLGFKVI